MFPSGTKIRSRLQWFMISVMILMSALTLPFSSFANANDPEPVAQIFAVLWQDQEVPQLSISLVTITRGPGGCPPTDKFVGKGVPLCKGDTVKTAQDVKVKIVFGDPKDRNEVTVGEKLRESEVKISSIWCGALCRWFASLSNRYTNRVQHVGLTNKSTVYEVISHGDSVELMVFEGEVDVTKLPPDNAENPNSSAAAEASPSPGSTPQTVPRLYKAIINPDGTITDKQAMDQTTLCTSLALSSSAEVWRHRTPPEFGGYVAKSPNFENSVKRSNTFQTARCASFWEPSQGQHFETLGYVYNDWNNGQKALELFAQAAKLYEAANPNWAPTDQLRINKAMALRQLRQPEDLIAGLQELEPVLAKTESSFIAKALNVRGSIFYDQARRELLYNRTDQGLAKARELLTKASADFDKALPQAGNQLQYVQVNRGQVLKAEGDIAQLEGNHSRAESKYIEAIKKLMDAYGNKGDNPNNKIAALLVARARADLANTYAAMGKPAQSEEFYLRAETTYKGVIEDATNHGQNFAAPHCGLGSLYLILGRREEAAKSYPQCVAYSTAALVTDITVPDVAGLPRAAAIQILAEAGLEPEIVEEGEVVETQEPAVQTVVRVGTKIQIKLRVRGRS